MTTNHGEKPSTPQRDIAVSAPRNANLVSAEREVQVSFPDGGFQAWLVVGWIFNLCLFLVFFVGVQAGPVFDRQGVRLLLAAGSLCVVASLMLLSISTTCYQIMLTYSVLGGLCALANIFIRTRLAPRVNGPDGGANGKRNSVWMGQEI
ncbi:uncharacterized protein G6M90_00g111840 [Metarhizium brunneum]|uniref:Uncharacterized protein n=1 Tax=Metarhizium brunneum TaxID=500148 RepID=A0A7D5YYX3_9HYPO|nr:hypothetical protein G6M90_00g111840 [Metarhizium brunneum]